jgi:DNA-binding PadR family transcriptional regulator
MTRHGATPGDERRRQAQLGEWACLGILHLGPAHGWAVATRLQPDGDIGRVWSLSRPLTYRALGQLVASGFVSGIGEEPGAAGPNRKLLAITPAGRAAFRAWARTPVEHLRDLRSELLLKLVLAHESGIDTSAMLTEQRAVVNRLAVPLPADRDPVALWRHESSQAALRFLDRLAGPPAGGDR